MCRFQVLSACSAVLVLFASSSMAADDAGSSVDFNRDIRPTLSDKCFACHGPDPETREADLRFDLRDGAIRDLGGYAAIVPGDINTSELMARILSDDPDLVMPPPDYGKPVTEQEANAFRRWILEGAVYQEHWSFQPIAKPEVPSVDSDHGNSIDRFLLRRLEAEGITPNPQADSRVLARRLSFDLTGLPPTPEIVEAFAGDPTDDRYRQLVESLLASPQYGERMAMYWLDLVRYADSLGYHGDQPRSVSPYRDYVIRAFNDNMPFDQFTTEQLAGDLLPNATLSQKVASTYNRLNRASGEGGVQPKEYLAKYSADRVRTTGAVWLGTTVGCAECHDHKFDPFTTHDFYSFAAFFADIKEQGIVSGARHIELLPVPTPDQEAEQGRITSSLKAARERFARHTPELVAARETWAREVVQASQRWTVLQPTSMTSTGGATLTAKDNGALLVSGKNPARDTYTINVDDLPTGLEVLGRAAEASAATDPGVPVALRLEVLPEASLPAKGPGRAGNGNFVLHEVSMTVAGQEVKWTSAKTTHNQNGHSGDYVINGHKNGWAILPQTGQRNELLLIGTVTTKPQQDQSEASSAIEIAIRHDYGTSHTIGHFRLSLVASDDVDLGTSADAELIEIAAIDADRRTAEQVAKLDKAFRETTPLLADERQEIADLDKRSKALKAAITTTLATTATTPREIRVLPRGNWMDDSGEVVQPALPEFLNTVAQTGDERLSRLDLAEWMTSAENPLVARAFVNRLWMLMFGQGLSRSVDDLGSQGEVPSHPQLLDWLASEFVESGWDIKHMIRLMVTSDAYRRSSREADQLRQHDPLNRLFARQSRYRLEAEMVRDNALAVSGLLDRTIGGKSVKPYQPAGYWAQLNFPKRTYKHDVGASQYRRGLYTHWQRTFLHPSMLAFDAPAREECTARRDRSTTPLQSLVLLNDPTFVEAARVLAGRMLTESDGSFDDRLAWLYRETMSRQPRPEEQRLLTSLYKNNHDKFVSDSDAAKQMLATGIAPLPESIDSVELAAWTAVTRALLNLHEFITRY